MSLATPRTPTAEVLDLGETPILVTFWNSQENAESSKTARMGHHKAFQVAEGKWILRHRQTGVYHDLLGPLSKEVAKALGLP